MVSISQNEFANALDSVLKRVARGESFVIRDPDGAEIAGLVAPQNSGEFEPKFYAALENLVHEIRTPAVIAVLRAKRLVEVLDLEHNAAVSEARALLAAVRRLEQVCFNTQFLANLATGRPIGTNMIPASSSAILDCIAGSLDDIKLNAKGGIRFQVDEGSFSLFDQMPIKMDGRLLDQMVRNLLDNAAKYSHSNTLVELSASLVESGRFAAIRLQNTGLHVSEELSLRLGNRGQRTPESQRVRAEGSGLGLYIVRELLAAQGGSLQVLPTNAKGRTEVRLLFQTALSQDQQTSKTSQSGPSQL